MEYAWSLMEAAQLVNWQLILIPTNKPHGKFEKYISTQFFFLGADLTVDNKTDWNVLICNN